MKLEHGEMVETYRAAPGVYVVTAVREALRYLKRHGREATCTMLFYWNGRCLELDINENVEDVVNRLVERDE